MAKLYNHKVVEPKWQKIWDDEKAFAASDDYSKPKYYALVEFPYPSGQGLHVGHPRPYTALDIVARKRRMQGYNVLYPMGWDAFGLPTENYAIQNKIHPLFVRLGPGGQHDGSELLQVDTVDFLKAVQGGACLQEGDAD